MRRFLTITVVAILVLALAAPAVAAVNLPPPLAPNAAAQWTPAPGGLEVYFAPNIPGNLFLYRGRYFYFYGGRWFRGRTPWGPWHAARRVPPAVLGLPPVVFK